MYVVRPWNNGVVESFNRRLRTECLNRNHLGPPARRPGGDWRLQGRTQLAAPAFDTGLPGTGRVRCGLHPRLLPPGLRYQLNLDDICRTQLPGGPVIGTGQGRHPAAETAPAPRSPTCPANPQPGQAVWNETLTSLVRLPQRPPPPQSTPPHLGMTPQILKIP